MATKTKAPPKRPKPASRREPDRNPFQAVAAPLPAELEPPAPDSPRGKILAAARVLFAEHGFNGTTTRAVADHSGVNLAMIHYYFGSKEQLYERMLAFEVLRIFRHALVAVPPELPPEDALLSIPTRLLTLVTQAPLWAKLFRREVADGGTYLRRAIQNLGDHGPLRARELFETIYRQGVRNGRLRDLPPDAVRELLLALGFSAAFLSPVMTVFSGRDLKDEAVLAEWHKTMSTVLRRGLVIEKEGRK